MGAESASKAAPDSARRDELQDAGVERRISGSVQGGRPTLAALLGNGVECGPSINPKGDSDERRKSDQRVVVVGGKIVEYRVVMKVAFLLRSAPKAAKKR